jgi:hypothetical protein
MRDAECFLAAVENERHDQVFLVVEMADQPFEQGAAGGRVVVAAAAQCLRLAGQRAQQRVGRFRGRRHVGVDGVVVAFQHVEAAHQPRLGGAEDREIMQILDLVVHIELRQ